MLNLKNAPLTLTAVALSSFFLSYAHQASAQTGQAANVQPTKKVYGYQDPETGEFHAMRRAAKPDATVAPTTGTVDVTLTISLKTPVPKGGVVVCGSTLGVEKIFSTGVFDSYDETASVVATVSGATATCTMTLPYAWVIATGTPLEETFSGTYIVEILTANGVQPGLVQSASGTYVSATTVPATGTVSKFTEAVTL